MAASVIRFVLDGSGKVVAQAKQMEAAFTKVATTAGRAASNFVGGGTSAQGLDLGSRAGRQQVGRVSRFAQYASSMGALGQIGSAVGSAPTAGMAAMGIAAVAVGVSLRQLGMIVGEQVRAIESAIRTTQSTRAGIGAAVSGANQSALSSVLGRREELIGGDRGTPEMREQFAKFDSLQRGIDAAQVDRAMKFGETELRGQLGQVRSPESAALLELNRKADAEIVIQQEIRTSLGWFQKVYLAFANAGSGRLGTAELNDAMANQVAVAAATP